MTISPLVSVIMPVYNGEKYLSEAISSVLMQTYKPLELIVINDGSTDNTENVLETFRNTIIYHRQENKGIAQALNTGIKLAKGKYIARLDADDIALAHRIEAQVIYLEQNPSIGILGSSANIIDEYGKKIGFQSMQTNSIEIRWKSLFDSPFIHPSIMMRAKFFNDYKLSYPVEYKGAEDYGLWVNLLRITEGYNFPNALINYRLHKQSISSIQKNFQYKNRILISKNNIEEILGIILTEEMLKDLMHLTSLNAVNYRSWSYDIYKNLINYLDLWKIFKEKYKDQSGLNTLEDKIITQCFGIIILYIPIIKKLSMIKELNSINNHWTLSVYNQFSHYIKKFITYKKILNYR